MENDQLLSDQVFAGLDSGQIKAKNHNPSFALQDFEHRYPSTNMEQSPLPPQKRLKRFKEQCLGNLRRSMRPIYPESDRSDQILERGTPGMEARSTGEVNKFDQAHPYYDTVVRLKDELENNPYATTTLPRAQLSPSSSPNTDTLCWPICSIHRNGNLHRDSFMSEPHCPCCRRARVPQLFERASPSWWNPRFDSDVLENQLRKTSIPQVKRQLRIVLGFVSVSALVWAIYLGVVAFPSLRQEMIAGCGALLLLALCTYGLTFTTLYDRYYAHLSVLWSLLLCLLSLVIFTRQSTASFLYLSALSPNSGLSFFANFATSLQVIVLVYTFTNAPLVFTLSLALLYSAIFITLSALRLSDNGDFTFRRPHEGNNVLKLVGFEVLLHFCLHILGIHIFLMSQVRLHSTFWQIGQSLIAKKSLELERKLKEKIIHSVMPPTVADELMQPNEEEMSSRRRKSSNFPLWHHHLHQQQLQGYISSSAIPRKSAPATANNSYQKNSQGASSNRPRFPSRHSILAPFHLRPQPHSDADPANKDVGDRSRVSPTPPSARAPVIFRPFKMNKMDQVSILFADIVGFTQMSSHKSAARLVALLNDLFGRFDNLCEACGCEKIATLGDCYYCVSGCPAPRPDHAVCCVRMGLSMIRAIRDFDRDNNQSVNMRVGIHTGTVLCGVVGTRRFKFDVWSNDVALANKLESTGQPGRVHLSQTTFDALGDKYEVEPSEIREGIKTYFIIKPKSPKDGPILANVTRNMIGSKGVTPLAPPVLAEATVRLIPTRGLSLPYNYSDSELLLSNSLNHNNGIKVNNSRLPLVRIKDASPTHVPANDGLTEPSLSLYLSYTTPPSPRQLHIPTTVHLRPAFSMDSAAFPIANEADQLSELPPFRDAIVIPRANGSVNGPTNGQGTANLNGIFRRDMTPIEMTGTDSSHGLNKRPDDQHAKRPNLARQISAGMYSSRSSITDLVAERYDINNTNYLFDDERLPVRSGKRLPSSLAKDVNFIQKQRKYDIDLVNCIKEDMTNNKKNYFSNPPINLCCLTFKDPDLEYAYRHHLYTTAPYKIGETDLLSPSQLPKDKNIPIQTGGLTFRSNKIGEGPNANTTLHVINVSNQTPLLTDPLHNQPFQNQSATVGEGSQELREDSVDSSVSTGSASRASWTTFASPNFTLFTEVCVSFVVLAMICLACFVLLDRPTDPTTLAFWGIALTFEIGVILYVGSEELPASRCVAAATNIWKRETDGMPPQRWERGLARSRDIFNRWWVRQVFGLVIASLPAASLLIAYFRNSPFLEPAEAQFYDFLLALALLHLINLVQLLSWLKALLSAVVAGVVTCFIGLEFCVTPPPIKLSALLNDPMMPSRLLPTQLYYYISHPDRRFNNILGGFSSTPVYNISDSRLAGPLKNLMRILSSHNNTLSLMSANVSSNTFYITEGGIVDNKAISAGALSHLCIEMIISIVLILLLVILLNREFEMNYRLNFKGRDRAQRDKEIILVHKNQAEWLLHNIIPKHVVEQLKKTSKYSRNHKQVGIIFATIVNFNELYDESFEGGKECLRVLNEVIGDFDELLDKPQYREIEKIKTIGSTFMAASGLNDASTSLSSTFSNRDGIDQDDKIEESTIKDFNPAASVDVNSDKAELIAQTPAKLKKDRDISHLVSLMDFAFDMQEVTMWVT
ncbi:unnamed protein product [Gordionus sp. m RMFG-2023]